MRVFSVHPGLVEAEDSRGAIVPSLLPFSKDKAMLFGGVSLYLATPTADFLRGGFYSVSWDLDELQAHGEEVKEKKLVKLAFLEGKLREGGYDWAA